MIFWRRLRWNIDVSSQDVWDEWLRLLDFEIDSDIISLTFTNAGTDDPIMLNPLRLDIPSLICRIHPN